MDRNGSQWIAMDRKGPEKKTKEKTGKSSKVKQSKGKERKWDAKTTSKNNQNHIMIECNDMIDCAATTKERERSKKTINDNRLTIIIMLRLIMEKRYNKGKIEETSIV
jgi:hypothetical protein